MIKTRWWAASELLLSTSIWGFGFTATVWGLQSFDSITLTVLRFYTAFFVGQAMLFLPLWRREICRRNLVLSMGPGLVLGFMIGLQTWGLESTSVTNSGFITTLYVVFVPIIEFLFFKKSPSRLHYFWVALALLGTAILFDLNVSMVNKGDLLTLACAILGAVQIIWIDQVSDKITSPFAFNVYQSLWACLAAIVFWPLHGVVHFSSPTAMASVGFLSLTLGSTLLAFALQVKAQKVLPSSVASLLFLLESPFAMVFAILLLHENVTTIQCVGAITIFLSALGATYTSRLKRST